MPIRSLSLLLATLALTACATPRAASLAEGSEAQFDGRLIAVDTAPWAFDGNAKLTVETTTQGTVIVELPARWNLCKATGIGEAGSYKAGDRVSVAGTVTAPGTVTVCTQATHRIARLP